MHQILVSHHAEKNYTWFGKKNFLNRSFLKIMVGTFSASCTVTGNPCSLLPDVHLRRSFFCLFSDLSRRKSNLQSKKDFFVTNSFVGPCDGQTSKLLAYTE